MIPPKPRDAVELTPRDLAVVSAPPAGTDPDIIVTVAAHSAAHDLSRCLASIEAQDLPTARLGVVILLDTPRAEPWAPKLPPRLADRVWVLRANCGKPARARNAMIEFVEQQLPFCMWIARLDWDDRFAERHSLRTAVEAGEAAGAGFVLGGNRVLDHRGRFLNQNPAGSWVKDKLALLRRLREMAEGRAENELPSCNLVLRSDLSARYPDTSSAEDHWLVADLLVHHAGEGTVLESPLYADYTLNGETTSQARSADRHQRARRALFSAVNTWLEVGALPGRRLGLGQEGIVREHAGTVFKHFYPGILTRQKVDWLSDILSTGQSVAPRAEMNEVGDSWVATYPAEHTMPFEDSSPAAVADFLSACLRDKLVCGNIKRTNFRVRSDGSLLYIDIGNWLVPMDVSILRDSAARLYSIGVSGASDEELLRRPADHTRPIIWDRLPRFAEFYREAVARHINKQWEAATLPTLSPFPAASRPDVTLLIKACAMDAMYLQEQVEHIVRQLIGPSNFAERLLLIDSYKGPFLRAHSPGDLGAAMRVATELQAQGTVDRVLVAPTGAAEITAANLRWFGTACPETHTCEGIPVTSQLWAFDQVSTRFVLQCDVDILVGRRDLHDNYLEQMVKACQSDDVCGCAFNIPHDPASPPQPFCAPPGGFKPEVRCGLLDLDKLRSLQPLPNAVVDGKLEQPWYRSLHTRQKEEGFRTLRGGHPDTFYVHPLNALKEDPASITRVRDLVEQGRVPQSNWDRWDVVPNVEDWRYLERSEQLVVVARGRNTPTEKIDRFARGLAIQTDQTFGIIAIDDGSDDNSRHYLRRRLASLGDRLTLIRHSRRRGRAHNSVIAIRHICTNPDSAIVVVDLDDALADRHAVAEIRSLFANGHDVVLAAPFQPDMPTKIYNPVFENPRQQYGGDVWIHLRAFTKLLFDRLPDEALQIDGRWLEMCEDYAAMLPIVEQARSPVYIPEFWYWHERTTGKTAQELRERAQIIENLLSRPGIGAAQQQHAAI